MTATEVRTPTQFREALALFKDNQHAAARDLLRACLIQEPGHVGSLLGLAVCESKLGDPHAAHSLLREVIERDPRHTQAHYMLGRVLLDVQDKQGALAQFHHVLTLEPGHAEAVKEIARLTPQEKRQPNTIAEWVDDPESELDGLRTGKIILQGHRSVLSHRRLWLGFPMAGFGLLLLSWAGDIRNAAPAPKVVVTVTPNGLGRRLDDSSGDLVRTLASFVQLLGWFALLAGVAGMVAAFANSALSQYVVREKRIEITEGVFRRVRRTIWLYRIYDVRVVQNIALMLAGTARLTIHAEDPAANPATKIGWWQRRPASITGVASTHAMVQLMEDLQRRSIIERRAMKKAFI